MSRSDETPELPLEDAPPRDGIDEEDNPIPAWFNISWIASWILGILYIGYYLGVADWTAASQYQAEVAVAEVLQAEIRANLPTSNPFRDDHAAISEGQEVFVTICGACHKPDGTGLVGPSLVDPYFKYGEDDKTLFQTVAEGRPGGMPPWGAVLGNEKIWKALAYMQTLPRSTEPGFGAPDYQPATP